jgi:serine protease inhibitor
LSALRDVPVSTVIPKFESKYFLEIKDVLTGIGMSDTFDADAADFTGLGV